MSNPHNYTVAWICAVSTERVAAEAFLDEEHALPAFISPHDNNNYKLGRIRGHMVVIAVLPHGEYGISSAACVARDLLHTFPNVRIGLMVGIGGGAPSEKHDIRLGDVVVGATVGGKSSVFQYDFGKAIQDQPLELTGFMNQAPPSLRAAVSGLKSDYEGNGHTIQGAIEKALAKKPRLRKKYKSPGHENDRLYQSHVIHQDGSCSEHCGDDETVLTSRPRRTDEDDDPTIHYGVIASADKLMKDATVRDSLAREHDVLCFEMEAAGLMNHFPCLVIRGICDYSDTHKNDQWQGYAAMVAAAYAKDLLLQITPSKIENERKIVDILSELEGSVRIAIEELKPVSKIIHSEHDRKILNWLTSHDYAISHKDIFAKAEPGTGQWFLDSQPFRTWLNNDKQSLLCCGNPGAGKTVITSLVVNHLLSEFQQSPEIGIAYIYCDYHRRTQQGATDILSSLLKQLSQTKAPLPKSVQDLYQIHEKFRTHPTFHQISEALFSVSEEYSKVFILIDALDECNASDNTRATVLKEMLRLQDHATVSIFATSRPNLDVSYFFSGSLTQDITATDDDIGRYVNRQIFLNESLIIDDGLRVEVINKVVAAADGMFLLASLQISTLLSQPTKGHLLELLRTFNKGEQGLDEHYGQAMRRIQDQEPNRKALAMKILTWIVHAERPLSMQELKHAVAVCENSDELDENYIPRSKIILSLCAGLVVLDEESRMVRLVHYTTQEYFERHENAWFEDAETEMIITCGTYLSFTSGLGISESFPEERLWPLYPYALYHWHHHVREIPGRASEWLLRFAKSEIRIPVNESSDFSGGSVAGLHLAAYFGLGHVAACLIDGGYCADEHDIYDRTPLSYAADAGRQSTINLLLATKDVDPNSSPKAGAFEKMTPLIFASINGHEAVVNLLLDVDHADIDAQDAQGNTALYHAVTCRNMSIVAVLIEKGPSMEINNNDGQTVLAVAAGDCNMDGVEILLRYGANPNPKPATGTGRTPLSSAARRGDTSIVRLLLATGADACLRRGLQRHTPPLLLAAKNDCEDVVEVLLQRGVDPEGVPEASRTPFSLATDAGNMTVAKPLFDSGKIDPDSKCSRGLTPLFYAACGGHSDIVKLLLDTCEVDPDINDSKGRTPLSFAASGGHVATVEILLGASGVDTDSKDRNGLTPLSYAAGGGRKAIVEMLLSASGVDPDSKDIEGRTPLSHAAAHGQQAIVELLLGSCRVDPNSRAEEQAGMTPLGFACLRGRLAVVKILLNDDRVDPDSKLSEDGNGGPTELFRAASHGREAILQLLLDTNRVDVNMTDKNGWTPLEYAKNNTIRRMLRDKGGQRGRDL